MSTTIKQLEQRIKALLFLHSLEGGPKNAGTSPAKMLDAQGLQKVISPNVRDQRKISMEWMKVWEQIEIWYGDILRHETGQQLLERLQKEYDLSERK